MGWIITILVGALCGWLASMIMKTDAQQGAVANILIGIVGSILAQALFGNMLNLGGDVAGNGFSFWSRRSHPTRQRSGATWRGAVT